MQHGRQKVLLLYLFLSAKHVQRGGGGPEGWRKLEQLAPKLRPTKGLLSVAFGFLWSDDDDRQMNHHHHEGGGLFDNDELSGHKIHAKFVETRSTFQLQLSPCRLSRDSRSSLSLRGRPIDWSLGPFITVWRDQKEIKRDGNLPPNRLTLVR